jgi:hypothetical protein
MLRNENQRLRRGSIVATMESVALRENVKELKMLESGALGIKETKPLPRIM